MIETLETVYIALAIVVVLYLFVRTWAKAQVARRNRARAMKHLLKAADGTIYVRDPQTRTLHRLDELIAQRYVEHHDISPRQRRRVRRQLRQALRTH